MTISRADLLKELLPGLNQLFGMEYAKFNKEMRYRRELLGGNSYVHGLGRLYEGFAGIDAADERLSDAQDAARYDLGCKTGGR
jgi:hypothetical protein